jgi:hypothetical protein
MRQIEIPNGFEPRPYQAELMHFFDTGGLRAAAVWHRRSGKDLTMLHQTAKMGLQRIGGYFHMLPEFSQARKVIWDGIDIDGNRIIDQAFPHEIRRATHESEMKITLLNGSYWQLVGSDRYDALMGTNPLGVVFSEYSIANPSAWDYIRPILVTNHGWAAFIYTPRGRNHGYSMHNIACADPFWFSSLKTVDDTGAINTADIEAERRAGMPEDMIQQEFYCSFTSGALGSYYGELLERARQQGRICPVPFNPGLPVELWFDLGYNDYTSCWAIQKHGLQLHAIRFNEWRTMSLPRICADIRTWEYRIDKIKLPHDGDAHELIAGRTRKDVIEDELGTLADVVPRPRNLAEKLEQIHAVRSTIPLVWFDATLCEAGVYALESYSRKWDDKGKVYGQEPKHDWSSHCADAFRTGCADENGSRLLETAEGRRTYGQIHRVIRAGESKLKRPIDDNSWLIDARELDRQRGLM